MRQGDTPYLISPNAMLLHDPDEKRSVPGADLGAVRIPLWNSLRAGRWALAHGLARVEETLARDSVAVATANVKAGTAP
jgi:hypothetical protein